MRGCPIQKTALFYIFSLLHSCTLFSGYKDEVFLLTISWCQWYALAVVSNRHSNSLKQLDVIWFPQVCAAECVSCWKCQSGFISLSFTEVGFWLNMSILWLWCLSLLRLVAVRFHHEHDSHRARHTKLVLAFFYSRDQRAKAYKAVFIVSLQWSINVLTLIWLIHYVRALNL